MASGEDRVQVDTVHDGRRLALSAKLIETNDAPAFIESVKRGVEPPIDVYDAAAWSVISPLSERSIAMGSEPVPFPDFTGGTWVTRRKIFGMSDEY